MRKEVVIKDTNLTMFVGWDWQFNSLFLMVYDDRVSEDENPVVWKGASPDEIHDVDKLNLMAYKTTNEHLPYDVKKELYGAMHGPYPEDRK